MSALLERKGYQATRYQGDTVVFRAQEKTIDLVGTPSAVQRDETLLVGDSIVYNDSTKIATARGDTVVLRDPSQGEDVRVGRFLEYDIARQFGKAYDVSTAVESGQKWIVHGGRTAFQRDTTGADQSAFYLRDGWLTSCTNTLPHYHFAAKEMKVVSKNVIVARPAILYIRDIPVLWLPFIFQDLRSGRRSGLIPPRFGFSDIVRNSPTYRRTIDNFGYYFALNDYLDAQVTMDWRSSAGATDANPGWLRFTGSTRYVWLDRFVDGQLSLGYQTTSSGAKNKQLSWSHRQDFSLRSHLNMSLNWVSNTQLQRQTTFNPYAALATIRSSLKYDQQIGGATLSIGGSQVQYTGRKQVDRDFPSINLSTQPLRVGEWLTWTPTVALQRQVSLNNDQPGQFSFFFRPNASGGIDSVPVKRNQANTSLSVQTPLKIVNFDWRNSLRYRDTNSDFPQSFVLTSPTDSSVRTSRVFASTLQSELDWDTGINLPSLFQGTWNLSPSVSFSNVDPGPLFVRNQFTGGQWVRQTKRPTFGLSSSPTFYALFPGLGPITRLRHAVQPQITFSYAPSAEPGNDYLRALNRSRQGYLGALAQNAVTLGLSTNIEAKLRAASTDSLQSGSTRTVKLVSLNFTPITYDIQRARKGLSGFTTDRLGITGRSDLLPGLDFGMDWSLFQGSVLSDTAVFKPFRESIRGTLSLNRQSGLVVGIARLFGVNLRAKPQEGTTGGTGDEPRSIGGISDRLAQSSSGATQPLGGSIGSAVGGAFGSIPTGQGFNASLTFTSTRQRPPSGNPANLVVNDPAAQCAYLRQNPFFYDQCLQTKVNASPPDNPFGTNTSGAAFVSIPARTNMQGSMNFNITPKWAARWSTTYDFVARRFASQIVSLQREMHDWNAIFAFTQSPNGNFAFNFFIAPKAEPDLKFNYDRRSFRRGSLGGLGTGTTTGQQ